MPESAFPADADIEALVQSAGLQIPSGFSYTGYGEWAKDEFQQRTGQIPFLKDTVDVARTYDPPGPSSKIETYYYKGGEKILELDAGLLACTSVALGVTPDNPTGTLLDLQRQLRLMPVNAPAKGQPWTWIEFYFPVYGTPSSVVVIGRWGYSANVPQDVWEGVRRLGASKIAKDLLEASYSTPNEMQIGEDRINQASVREAGFAWASEANRVVERYKLQLWGV